MELQLSTPIKLVALVGLLLAVVGGGSLTLLGRGGEADAGVPLPLAVPQQTGAVVTKANTRTSAKQAATAEKPAVTAKPKPQPAAKPKPKPATKPKVVVTDSGLPVPVATALATNRVVVVALYAPESAIDELALAEAQAGAKAANAGFVAVNVLREGQGRAMARLLGVTDSPTLLVYRAPGTLAFRLDGFADLDTVAQAALDARRGPGT